MTKKILFSLFCACFCAGAMVIDGQLDDAEWTSAMRQTNFKRRKLDPAFDKPLEAQTEAYILPQKDRIYIGVKCQEPEIEKLKTMPAGSMWGSDGIELFIAPDGSTTEYYQFLVTYNHFTHAIYAAESGNIQPDPYSPVWNSAVYTGKDFWSAEIELPLTAFYMTRQNIWNTAWRINVARSRRVISELSTLNQVKGSFNDLSQCSPLPGFPMRKAEDDVYISAVNADITGLQKGKPLGNIEIKVQLSKAGEYEFANKKFKLKEGVNIINMPYAFEKEGRNKVRIDLKRCSDEKVFSRFYPVITSYVPLKLNFSQPEFRRTFYPGQDFSKINGKVQRTSKAPVSITISGAGIPEQNIILKDGKEDFSFDSSSFDYGKATIKVVCGNDELSTTVQRLKPLDNGQPITWISNGNLMVDGKPVLRRNMYAEYYMGGNAFKEKYDADDLCQTKFIRGCKGWVEPARLIKGIEAKEATKDVKPCPEYFAELDKTIARAQKEGGNYYYISDEPECRGVSPVYLKYIYDYLVEKDPYRVVLIGSRACEKYIDCADWFETHPYINVRADKNGTRNYGREIKNLGNFLDEIVLKNRPDKCIGFMPTSFASRGSSAAARHPDFDEMICHTWAVMIRGCKTLFPYAYHDLGDVPSVYEGIRYIFTSADALQDFILLGKRTLLFHNQEAGAALWELNNEKMFALVNYTNKPIKASLKNISGNFVEFRGSRNFNAFDFDMKPHEVIIGTTSPKGTNLKNKAEVEAEINQKEIERCSTGNLLFNHQLDVEITTSKKTARIPYKMMDGTRDVVAFSQVSGKNKYYEISFPKPEFIPEFSKIRIYGDNMGTPTVKIRKRGQWVTLSPANTITDKYLVGFDYKEPAKTVKLRIEFPLNKLELYEIELLK